MHKKTREPMNRKQVYYIKACADQFFHFLRIENCSEARFNKSPSMVREYFAANVQRAVIGTNTSGVSEVNFSLTVLRFVLACLLYNLFQLTCEVDVSR